MGTADDAATLYSMKQTEDQLDDRVVEVCWDTERGTWRLLRLRDDKPHANHKSIMEKILISIEDGVEIDVVGDSTLRQLGQRY